MLLIVLSKYILKHMGDDMQSPFKSFFKERTFDLLQIKPIKKIILWSGFPYIFQALLLIIFILLIVFGWGLSAPDGVSDKLYAKSNIINLLVWGIWWPAMIWFAVLFGRAWCMVCPMELVSNISERLGRRLGIRQLKLSKWLLSGVIILISYATIQMLIAGAHLHRVPSYTAIFLLFLITTAFITGLFFEHRAYCRAFCTVGLLLNVYGRGGMLAVRPNQQSVCLGCDEKWCVNTNESSNLDARSCPTLLAPKSLNTSKDCLVCTQCIKSCQPNNMQLQLRTPFYSQDTRQSEVSWPTLLFIMLLSGFVTYELSSEWSVAKTIFLQPVYMVIDTFGLQDFTGWVKGAWTLFIFPILLWGALGVITLLLSSATSLTQVWKQMALPLVVVIAAGHMSKALAKLTSWGEFLPYTLHDPLGTTTVQTFTENPNLIPSPLLEMPTVAAIATLLIIIATFFAARESKLADPAAYSSQLPSILLLAGLYITIILGWF